MPNSTRSIYIVSLILTLYLPYLLWSSLPPTLLPQPLIGQWKLHPQQPPVNSVRLIGEHSLEYIRTRNGAYYDLVPIAENQLGWVEVEPRILATSISPQLDVVLPAPNGGVIDGIEFVSKVGRIRPNRSFPLKLPFIDNAKFSFDYPEPDTFNAFALLEDGSLWYIEDSPAVAHTKNFVQKMFTGIPLLIGTAIAFFTAYRRQDDPINSWVKRNPEWFNDNELTRLCGVVLGGSRFALVNFSVALPFVVILVAIILGSQRFWVL